MVSVSKKQIAMFFIMLLAVQEVTVAFRVNPRRLRAADLQSRFESSTPASKQAAAEQVAAETTRAQGTPAQATRVSSDPSHIAVKLLGTDLRDGKRVYTFELLNGEWGLGYIFSSRFSHLRNSLKPIFDDFPSDQVLTDFEDDTNVAQRGEDLRSFLQQQLNKPDMGETLILPQLQAAFQMTPEHKGAKAALLRIAEARKEVAEAARVLHDKDLEAAVAAEAPWKAENKKCGSSRHPEPGFSGIPTFCNPGPEHPDNSEVHHCARQAMLGDRPGLFSDQVCRVTDEWMLAGTTDKASNLSLKSSSYWLSMQIVLLNAKSTRLVQYCSKDSPARKMWQCHRQMQYVLRIIKFIGKASGEQKHSIFGALTPDKVIEARNAADSASEKIAGLVFDSTEKQNLFKRDVEALKKDQHGLQKNPIARIKATLNVLKGLLQDDADLEGAENQIQDMEQEAKPAVPADEEAFKESMEVLKAKLAKGPQPTEFDEFDKPVDDSITEMVMEDKVVETEDGMTGNSTRKSSLMQRRVSDAAMKGIGFVVLVFLVILAIKVTINFAWGLLVLLVFGPIFVCSVKAVSGEGQVVKTSRAKDWGRCVGHWIKSPFVLAKDAFNRIVK